MTTKQICPKEGFFDAPWTLIEESENYYIAQYGDPNDPMNNNVPDALLKSEYMDLEEWKKEHNFK